MKWSMILINMDPPTVDANLPHMLKAVQWLVELGSMWHEGRGY